MKRTRVLSALFALVVGGAAAAGVVTAGDVAQATPSNWTATAAVLPADANGSQFASFPSESCPSTTACFVLGDYQDTANDNQAVVDEVTGGGVTATELPVPADAAGSLGDGQMNAVSCASTTSCVVVGQFVNTAGSPSEAVIDTLSGTTWTSITAPVPADVAQNPDSNLISVSCNPDLCVAVGQYQSGNANVSPGLLDTLSNGKWSATAAPLPANANTNPSGLSLNSVSCSGVFCVAVSEYQTDDAHQPVEGLIETLSNGSWSATEAPQPSGQPFDSNVELSAVSCPSSTFCAAVAQGPFGLGGNVLYTDSAGTWTGTEAPTPPTMTPGDANFSSISCGAVGQCVAVGFDVASGQSFGIDTPIIFSLANGIWTARQPSLPSNAQVTTDAPYPGSYSQGALNQVSCLPDGTCQAVGFYYDKSNLEDPLIDTLVAGSWVPTQAPEPVGSDNQFSGLTAVSCASDAICDATGAYEVGSNEEGMLEAQSALPAPGPVVTSIAPTSGGPSGGASVMVHGSGFTTDGSTTIDFGPAAATSFTCSSSTLCTGTSPAGSSTVDVTATTSAGSSATSSADQFTYLGPAVTSIDPAFGSSAGGYQVVISGAQFDQVPGSTTVNFGGSSVSASCSATTCNVTAPGGTAGNTVDVTVTTPAGTSAITPADQFTYTTPPPPAPKITSISPNNGLAGGGTQVTITGTNFATDGSAVADFGDNAAGLTSCSPATTCIAFSPAGVGEVPVTITDDGGTSNPAFFQYTGIVISDVSPDSGPPAGGTMVTITGSGFTQGTGTMTVTFGGNDATNVVCSSATTCTATTPAGSGTVGVVIANSAGKDSSANSSPTFTYFPVGVTSVSPNSGAANGGLSVTVNGYGFTTNGTTTIAFGSTASISVTCKSATTCTAAAPPGSGTVDVTVTSGGVTSVPVPQDHFTYVTPPVPTVTGVSPNTGPAAGGTPVMVTGTGFLADGLTSIDFGSSPATSVTCTTSTSCNATSPSGSGTVDVTATTAGGTSSTGSADHFTYQQPPQPMVTAIAPSEGPTDGGTMVAITGSGFATDGTTTVDFGTTAGTNVSCSSPTMCNAISPSEGAGTEDITVTTVGGTSSTSSVDLFTYVGLPSLSAINPISGPIGGGTPVTITGTNFATDGTTTVDFGMTASANVTCSSTTSCLAASPSAAAGTVDVTVTTVGGTSAVTQPADQFTYVPAPTVSSVTPSSGPTAGGTTVTINGSNLARASVAIDGHSVPPTCSETECSFMTPPDSAGKVTIAVTTPGGTADGMFTYVGPPTVSSVIPDSGPTAGGTPVTINGTGFDNTATVTFGGEAATAVSCSTATACNATSPAGSGAVDVVVATTSGGPSATSQADQFTYVPAPTVGGILPASGPAAGGTRVQITGTGFDTTAGTTSVMFGSQPGSSPSCSSMTICFVTSPAGSPGSVDVTVTTPSGTSTISRSDQFQYNAPPTVTSVSPGSGPLVGGTTVTITGTGFDAATSATTITFGGTTATQVTCTSMSTCTAMSPAGSGTVDVVVTTIMGGQSGTSSADRFTFVPPPTVTSVSPASGPTAGGTGVIVTGTNLSGASLTIDDQGVPSTCTATSCMFTTPSGSAGQATITVTTPGGTADGTFTYESAPPPVPAVTGISPTSGSTAGGAMVTITGTGFATDGSTTVTFGTTPATGTVNCATSISCTATAPAHSAGIVDVRVTTAGGTSLVSQPSDQFTYIAPPPVPAVTGISPSSGSTAGGALVTITGTGFATDGSTTVTFGTTPATGTVNCATSISCTATAPAHSAGIVDVTVTTTAGGTSSTSAADQFTYIGPPTVTSLSPNSGPTSGGTPITIFGSNLAGAVITIDGHSVSSSCSASNCTFTTPPDMAGPVTVHVATASGSADATFTYVAPTSSSGYDLVGADGGVFVFGSNGGFFGSLPQLGVHVHNIVGMVASADDQGYLLVGSDGGVFSFGDTHFEGSLPLQGVKVNDIVGIVPTSDDLGYFLVGRDGGVFAFGDAVYLGSLPGSGVTGVQVIGIAATPDNLGYWLVTSKGTVYAFGDAHSFGSLSGVSGATGISGSPSGQGYWIVTANGGVYPFGTATSYGSLPALGVTPALPVISLVPTADQGGYWLIATDGGLFAFGDAPFIGSLPSMGVHVTDIVGGVPTR